MVNARSSWAGRGNWAQINLDESVTSDFANTLNTLGAPVFTVTRRDGTTRQVQMSVQPYLPDATAQLAMEGFSNLSADAPVSCFAVGTADLQEGDFFPLREFTYRIASVLPVPFGAGYAYVHAHAIRYTR
jgi:hypothetical protein